MTDKEKFSFGSIVLKHVKDPPIANRIMDGVRAYMERYIRREKAAKVLTDVITKELREVTNKVSVHANMLRTHFDLEELK